MSKNSPAKDISGFPIQGGFSATLLHLLKISLVCNCPPGTGMVAARGNAGEMFPPLKLMGTCSCMMTAGGFLAADDQSQKRLVEQFIFLLLGC